MSICSDVRGIDGRNDEIDDVNGSVVRLLEAVFGSTGSTCEVALL